MVAIDYSLVHGFLDRQDAHEMLQKCLPGTFLIRFSQSQAGLSVAFKKCLCYCVSLSLVCVCIHTCVRPHAHHFYYDLNTQNLTFLIKMFCILCSGGRSVNEHT